MMLWMLQTAPHRPFVVHAQPTEPDLLAKYFKVLSDPTRLRILELLDEHDELCVGALVGHLGLAQSNVSNHLACLRWCGFVDTRREHRVVFYRVADERVVKLLVIGRSLLLKNTDHVASCRRVGGSC